MRTFVLTATYECRKVEVEKATYVTTLNRIRLLAACLDLKRKKCSVISRSFKSANLRICVLRNLFAKRPPLLLSLL
jgi:hypothetical protein